MTTLLLRKTPTGALEPVEEIGHAALSRISVGDVVRAEVKRVRNLQHHRKLFALINLIFQNQSRYRDADDMLDDIKVYVGHCETRQMRDGTIVKRPKSIAFDKMDQAAFEEFYDKVVDVVCTEIVPGLDRDDLRRELMAFAA